MKPSQQSPSQHPRVKRLYTQFLILSSILLLAACGDSDPAPVDNTPPPEPPPVTTELSVQLSALQVVGGSSSTDSATANLVINEDDLELTATVTFQEAASSKNQGEESQEKEEAPPAFFAITPTSVQIFLGFAGEQGELLVDLVEQSDDSWIIEPAFALTQEQRDLIDAGGLYIEVKSSENPDGALRGQVIGSDDVEVRLVMLSPSQIVPQIASMATGIGALTVNDADSSLSLHVNTNGLGQQLQSHIHQQLAGANGPILFELQEDPNNNSHWFVEGQMLSADDLNALELGELYIVVHTEAYPGGELRGQIYDDNTEVFFTNLTGGDVVPPVETTSTGVLASTLYLDSMTLSMHLNTSDLDDATAAVLRQAPVAQNGPVALSFEQDVENPLHWFNLDYSLEESQYLALKNQGLYASVYTPAFPAGEIRGQLQPNNSSGSSQQSFQVSAISPANGATVETFPSEISLQFNRDVLASTVQQSLFSVQASGGDMSFGDGNELDIPINGLGVDQSSVSLDIASENAIDDTYQVRVQSLDSDAISDTTGNLLDGDADGNPGGDFISTFALVTPDEPLPDASLSDVQEILTTNCATSGCHSGANPAQGMNLSVGQTFGNTVNQASSEVPSLFRVAPGDPDNSYLVQKIEGTAAVGSRMPLGQAPLSNEQIQIIRGWIAAGAEDDGSGTIEPFVISSITPSQGSDLEALPADISLIFNRDLDPNTVVAGRFTVQASGGDDTFNDGNETAVSFALSSSGATVTLALTDGGTGSDTYQITVASSSGDAVTDQSGFELDGDQDGNAGGDFVSIFRVTEPTPAPTATLTRVQNEIFNLNCATSGCHAGAFPAQGMNLSEGSAFSNIVNVSSSQVPSLMRVAPGDPDNSYIVQKVMGTAAVGSRMPLGGAPLSDDQIQLIRDWISDGAENN